MKINVKRGLKYARLLVCLAAFTFAQQATVVMCQQREKPITRANLISSLRLGRAEGMTAERYIELINAAGVGFSLTAKDEQTMRRVGKYLGEAGLDNLVAAIRKNYRPAVSSNVVERGEPTEEEMKEAWERTMQKRGGQQRTDGSTGFDNFIAGADIKIVKFEKLGCTQANYGAGYFCNYDITTSLSVHSNEGTTAGDEYAKRLDTFLGVLGGKSLNGTSIGRFMRSKDGWIVSNQ